MLVGAVGMAADTERFLFVHRFTNGKAVRKLRLWAGPLLREPGYADLTFLDFGRK